MNILHLQYAIAVSEEGSISKAAEKLFVAQPNVSRAIKDLETEFDMQIFDRNSKGMIPTPEGERLLSYGKKILSQLKDLEGNFKNKTVKKVFSLAVPRVSYISYAFAEFSNCLKDIDNVEIFYQETNAYKVIENIINGDYKLGIIRFSKKYDKYFKTMLEKKELKYELVSEFKYVIVCSKTSALNQNKEIYFSDLCNYVELVHADPFVPSLPVSEITRNDMTKETTRKIYIFERASQFELLSMNDETFMWVSPVPKETLDRYGLIERECVDNEKVYKDLLIYSENYQLSALDCDFITKLCECKRRIMK